MDCKAWFLLIFSIPFSVWAGPSLVGVTALPKEEAIRITDDLIFNTPLADFLYQRQLRDPKDFDWTSNGCTGVPDNPFGFDMKDPCARHDFAYHNYRLQDRFTSDTRKRIDRIFKKDMIDQCWKEDFFVCCEFFATAYYWGTRAFAGKQYSERDDEVMAHYDEALATYEEELRLLQEQGLLNRPLSS